VYGKYCELRDKSGLNDYQVAKESGIYQSTFTDWKTGRSKPGVEKLAKIAKVLGCQIEDFLEDEETE
jgi:repressor LexA